MNERCETGACIEVTGYPDAPDIFRLTSARTGTSVMQCSRAELIAFRDRIKAGELDYLDRQEAEAH